MCITVTSEDVCCSIRKVKLNANLLQTTRSTCVIFVTAVCLTVSLSLDSVNILKIRQPYVRVAHELTFERASSWAFQK